MGLINVKYFRIATYINNVRGVNIKQQKYPGINAAA